MSSFESTILVFTFIGFVIFLLFGALGGFNLFTSKSNKLDSGDRMNDDAEELLNFEKEKKERKKALQDKYKAIAKFYNNYKFIDYSNPKNKKILTQQMKDIVNVVDKNLHEAVQINERKISYRMLLVGMITFKHVTKERFKEVNIDLIKLYKLGEEVRFNGVFMSALERILDEQNEFGI